MWRLKDTFDETPMIVAGTFKCEAQYLPGANEIRLKGDYDQRLVEHRFIHYLNHEYMHWILFKLEGLRTSTMYDNIWLKFEETWNLLPLFLPDLNRDART